MTENNQVQRREDDDVSECVRLDWSIRRGLNCVNVKNKAESMLQSPC